MCRYSTYVKARDEPRAADALAKFKSDAAARKAEGVSHVVVRVEIDGLFDNTACKGEKISRREFESPMSSVCGGSESPQT